MKEKQEKLAKNLIKTGYKIIKLSKESIVLKKENIKITIN